MLKQKARISWLKEGDRNTKFFHQAIQRRRSRNNIRKLTYKGKSIIDPLEIRQAFHQHYKDQFSKRSLAKLFSVKELMNHLVTQEDNDFISREVTEQELELALQQSSSDKAPGPDGMNAGALKSLWSLLKGFIETGKLPSGMNFSFISLIPKVKLPMMIKDFRPISLINCSLKLFSKILTNRIISVMDKLISPNQTGFIRGRQISEGILITNEVVH